MKQEFKGKFQLNHGCISLDERITSRDIANPTYFENIKEARDQLTQHKEFYCGIGYKIWFYNIREWNPETNQYAIVDSSGQL